MENIVKNEKRNKLDRPITGIIQKDRIWEQWYDQDVFKTELPKMTQKDYLFECNSVNRDFINYRGLKKYSVDDFKKMVFLFEKAFAATGLKTGDVICTIGLTTPEMYAIKYAATSLGLITCNLNVLDMGVSDDGKNRLYKQIENVNPKMIFTLDFLEDKIYSVINDNKFKNIVKVSMPLDYSTPKLYPERAVLTLKKIKDNLSSKAIQGSLSLKDFLNMGTLISNDKVEEKYEPNLPCNISFTSGTTGINKAVLLSHDANNALAYQQKIANFGFEVGSKHLALLPPFLAFWDADVVHVTLCLGAENIIELSIDYKDIPKYFKKYGNINIGIWPQYLWGSLLDLPEKDLRKISESLKIAIVGGERCEINSAENFYNKTGVVQLTGYGASEVNTTFSVTHPNCNKVGSCGLPLPFNNVKIVDESFNDVTYNCPGRLLITSPCLMNGYYKRDDLTKQALYTDEFGTTWYMTGDYAVMDTDGCLTVLDRYKAPVTLHHDGKDEKINLLDIVEKIKLDRNIKICKMTSYDNKIVLHTVLDSFTGKSKEEAIDSIKTTIKNNLEEKFWPDFISIVDELPRTSVGKVNYNLLEEMGKNICEENISSEKLAVIYEKVKEKIKGRK